MTNHGIPTLDVKPVVKPLSLKNSGKLEIVFIGVGSASAIANYQTNFFLIKGDTHVLVDFGSTGVNALKDVVGLSVPDIRVVLPTHSHADHIGRFETLGIDSRYVGVPILGLPKVQVIITQEYQRVLWDGSLRGGMEYNEREDGDRLLGFGDYFGIIRPKWITNQPREIWEVQIGDIHLEIFRTKHTPDSATQWENAFVSYGLFVDGRVFISCDTRYDPDLIDMYADRSEVMFHDGQFWTGGVHASLEELSAQPLSVRSKMFIKHYTDDSGKQDISGFAGFAQQGVRYILK